MRNTEHMISCYSHCARGECLLHSILAASQCHAENKDDLADSVQRMTQTDVAVQCSMWACEAARAIMSSISAEHGMECQWLTQLRHARLHPMPDDE